MLYTDVYMLMDDKMKMKFSSVSKVVNIVTAKKISFFLVLALFVIKGIHLIDSGDQCRRLLDTGTLVDGKFWQPDGCMLHQYKISEGKKCLTNRKIAFVGDSRVRELFFTVVEHVSTSFQRPNDIKHSDISYSEDLGSSGELLFLWRPEVNSSVTTLYKEWMKNPSSAPDVVIQSAATHTIKNTAGSARGLQEFKDNLTKAALLMNEVTIQSKMNLYWLLQEPVAEEKLYKSRHAITNELISSYNDISLQTFEDNNNRNVYPHIFVVKSTVEVAKSFKSSHDGLHMTLDTLRIDAEIFLNLLCNEMMAPTDGTCCVKPPSFTFNQIIMFSLGCLSILASIFGQLFIKTKSTEKNHVEAGGVSQKNAKSKSQVFIELTSSIAVMFLILFYFYICDRTDIFMKSNKHYAHMRFFIPLLYIGFLGMFGIDQSKSTDVLNRDQTDEWKGWMQLIILVYHINGASVNIPIYMHIRLLVAMYLFMTGYGHFSYFWNKGDFSFYRLFNVLFRLNFLTVLLCVVMDRSYQFYYFVPLCTFWFLVFFVSMAMWPRAHLNRSDPDHVDRVDDLKGRLHQLLTLHSPTSLMSFKLLALLLFIIFFFFSQDIFEFLFSWWPVIYLFELPHGSVTEWWFRCQLDRYALLHGAVFSFGYLILKRVKLVDDSRPGCLMSTKASLIVVTASISCLITYMLWAIQCTSKVDCNHIHTYASVLPITSFILIRNIPGYLRSNYSSFFAWFGKISLELFIGQYHIWLAADTKGILVLTSPTWPTFNIVVTTFIFVCVAHEINRLTGVFANHCVGSSRDGDKTALIRFLIIVFVLIILFTFNNLTRQFDP